MSAIYNEIDPSAAAWTEELIRRGLVAPGRVERKSIAEIKPEEIAGATQFHTFAGIAVWSHALRLAGWPDGREVWTGSCPCQPYSVAGKQLGDEDERNLWPAWFKLIKACQPKVVIGEQVASVFVVGKVSKRVSKRAGKKPDAQSGGSWIDTVRTDLEGIGYTFGFAVLPAASVGAPHIRSRVYFAAVRMADASGHRLPRAFAGQRGEGKAARGVDAEDRGEDDLGFMANAPVVGRERRGTGEAGDGRDETRLESERLRDADTFLRAFSTFASGELPGGLGNADSERAGRNSGTGDSAQAEGRRLGLEPRFDRDESQSSSATDGLVDSFEPRLEGHTGHGDGSGEPGRDIPNPNGSTPTSGFWNDVEWVYCRDDKWRPTQSRLAKIPDEPANGMGSRSHQCSHSEEEKESMNEDSEKAGRSKALFCVQKIDAQTEVRKESGITSEFQSPEVLQSDMHGSRNDRRHQSHECRQQSQAVAKNGEAELRSLQSNRKTTCASCRRKSAEQRNLKFTDFVRLLPSAGALAELHGDTHTKEAVQALREAFGKEWPLLHARDSTQEIWTSLAEENKNRARVAFEDGHWVRVGVNPLSHGAPARVTRLRGFGNAIVAELAATFIRSVMEIL